MILAKRCMTITGDVKPHPSHRITCWIETQVGLLNRCVKRPELALCPRLHLQDNSCVRLW